MSEDEAPFIPSEGSDRTHMRNQPNRRAKGQLDIPFAKRERGQCPWPSWDHTQKSGPVCGLPSEPNRRHEWCRHHHRVAYVRPDRT